MALKILPTSAHIFSKSETFPDHLGVKIMPPFLTPKSTVYYGGKPKKGGILEEGPRTPKMSLFWEGNPITGCDFGTPKMALKILSTSAQIFFKSETFPDHLGIKIMSPFSTPKSTVFNGGKPKKGGIFGEGPVTSKMSLFWDGNPIAGRDFGTPKMA